MTTNEEIIKLAREIVRLAREQEPRRAHGQPSQGQSTYSRSELIGFFPSSTAVRGMNFPGVYRLTAERCSVSRRILDRVRREFIEQDLVGVRAGLMQRTALGDALAAKRVGREKEPLPAEIEL